MLRKSLKRTENQGSDDAVSDKRPRIRKTKERPQVLGSKRDRTDAEKVLEKLVLGGDEEILEELASNAEKSKDKGKQSKASPSFQDSGDEHVDDADKERRPVWEDEDDVNERINVISDRRHQSLRHGQEKKITGDVYSQRLQNQFQTIAGTPSWAKLQSEREADSSEEDSDTEEILKSTGNYLTSSDSLPSGTIQLKTCTDANKEAPSQGKLTSVEFHPSAQVLLTAGMDQRLNLFQVDGKNNPKIQSVFVDNFPIHTAHFSQCGEEVIMGSRHKSFYYYDMISGKIILVPQIKGIEEHGMGRFVLSPDGKFIVFLGKYGNIHLISAKSKEWIHSLKMNGSVDAVTFSPNGERMFSFGDASEVYVWSMNTRQCIHRFTDDGCVKGTALAASNNGQYLACGSYSGVVNIYSDESYMMSSNPKPMKAVMNLTTPCTSAMFNSTSEILAIASNYTERAVKMVHLPSATVFSNFPDKTDNIRIPRSLDFSLNSGYFTIGNHKGQALLYRIKHYTNY